MKAASAKQIKDALKNKSADELLELCSRLARFKKENKELLSYLLFESSDEEGYIALIKETLDDEFKNISTKSDYWVRKNIRKILKSTQKFIRYSLKNETQVELLLYFCNKMKTYYKGKRINNSMIGVYDRQMGLALKTMEKLHPDLQFDYRQEAAGLGNIR